MNKLDELLRFHHHALDLRARRQELIASNIANADTPNYKARDIDFSSALQEAIRNGDKPAAAAAAQYRIPTQASLDGNTVDMNQERAAFADNAVHYEASVTFLQHQLKLLLSAIQGQ